MSVTCSVAWYMCVTNGESTIKFRGNLIHYAEVCQGLVFSQTVPFSLVSLEQCIGNKRHDAETPLDTIHMKLKLTVRL